MQFNSLSFLFVFFPLFLVVYYGAGQRWQNVTLLLGSGVYYGLLGGWWNLGLVLLFVAVTYFAARMMRTTARKWLFYAVLAILFGCLLFFKAVAGGCFLPLGFSFVSFQLAAYLISVYKEKLEPETDFIGFCAGILMFPKLLAGPIMEPQQLCQHMRHRDIKPENINDGLRLLLVGLGFKVLLAGPVGGIWDQARVAGFQNISPIFAWLALLSFAMELYFDFYGYSVMARGLGQMLGFSLPRNFDSPYRALSVREFYRRWHQSLGRWFRDYLYIPLGGSRAGKKRTIVNIFGVWLLTGLWHGIGGHFLLWALFLGAMIVLERIWLGKRLENHPHLAHAITIFVILLSWIPFALSDWTDMGSLLGKLFCLGGTASNPFDFLFVLKDYFWLLLIGASLAIADIQSAWDKVRLHPLANWILFGLFWMCVYQIATVAQSPFAYFQF